MGSRSLQDGERPPAGAFTVGEWTAVPSANELVGPDGRRERVEPRAMDVLAVLHARRGEVVSTEEIRARVWLGAAVSGHSVAIVISDLRRVLGDSARSPRWLETVPKRGYRLRADEPRDSASAPAAAARRHAARALAAAAAAAIAALVLGAVVGGASIRLAPAPAPSLDAHTAEQYFRARQLWSRRDADSARRARDLLQVVIARAPAFAPAHAALADVHAHKTGEYLGLTPLEAFRAAEAHADRALALDPTLAEPWVSRALLDFYRDRQPRQALVSLARALEREPKMALAWQTRGMVLSALGEHEGSLEAIGKAAQLDPLSEAIAWDRVWFLYLSRRYDEAMDALEQASVRSPRNLFYEALIEDGRGRAQHALDLWLARFARRGVRLADPAVIRRRATPEGYRALLAQLDAAGAGPQVEGILLALFRLRAKDADGALSALEAFPAEHLWMRAWLHELPALDELRGHPRMQAVAAREGIATAALTR